LQGRCLYIVHFANAPIFAGGILGLEGISALSVWPAASTFTCLPPASMTRILLRLASLRPFASQFGRIGFVISLGSPANGGGSAERGAASETRLRTSSIDLLRRATAAEN
jgi:hypothetical protein